MAAPITQVAPLTTNDIAERGKKCTLKNTAVVWDIAEMPRVWVNMVPKIKG